MSKTSGDQYFLQNGGTLPRAKRPFRESHDKFKVYVFMHFPWFIKVEPKLTFAILVVYSLITNRFYQLYQQP